MNFPSKTKCGKCYTDCSACPYNADCPIAKENNLIDKCQLAHNQILGNYKRAVEEILNMAEIDSYILNVHGKGKYSVESVSAYNECIRDMKRVINSHFNKPDAIHE